MVLLFVTGTICVARPRAPYQCPLRPTASPTHRTYLNARPILVAIARGRPLYERPIGAGARRILETGAPCSTE